MQPQVCMPILSKSITWHKVVTHCKGFVAHFFDNKEQVLAIWFCWLWYLHQQIHMTDIQINYISGGNKHFQVCKPSHSPSKSRFLLKHIILLHCLIQVFLKLQSVIRQASIVLLLVVFTLSIIPTFPRHLVMILLSLQCQILIKLNTLFAWKRLITVQNTSKHFRTLSKQCATNPLQWVATLCHVIDFLNMVIRTCGCVDS